ncbi:MAG: class I SAM-dependent methyltransferase [Bacteroidales bacterium]|jgi:ubiquinone/menaquinone biosynthesis C-methylase UbiE|nr:class I SAM-dependent methyltransferase [Bacteroidales bacterium]
MINTNDNKFWDSFAGKYDKFILKYTKKTYARSLSLIRQELEKDSNVLEVGTGTGLVSFVITDRVKRIMVIDYEPEMINIANEKLKGSTYKNIEFKVNSATNIKQKDKTFNVVIASNIFHLIHESEKAMEEIIRLLVDDGKIILPTYCQDQDIKTHFISKMMSLTGFKVANKWSLKQFRKFIEDSGLKIKKEEIIKDKIPLSFIVASKN